jgi:hypothetical protein
MNLMDVRVVTTTAFPTATFLNVCHMSLFILGSIPVENSSISNTDGFPIKAIANESFL